MSAGEHSPDSIQDNAALPVCERVLSGVVWRMVYQGADHELRVLAPVSLTLAVWTYRQHLAALRHSLVATANGVRLNIDTLVTQVLAHNHLPLSLRTQLTPLILWWVGGGDGIDLPEKGGKLSVGTHTITVQPWSEQQRAVALQTSLLPETAEGQDNTRFDPVTYLHAMVQACASGLSADTLDKLDAAQSAALLEAAVRANIPEPDTNPIALLGDNDAPVQSQLSRYFASRTLRVCKALGWTPAKVWATPAVEIDQLLALLDQAEPPQKLAPQRHQDRPRLADAPDAVLIRIED